MSAAVAQILQEALLLSAESRVELVEALLEHSQPADEFLERQLAVVSGRMQNVQDGTATLVDAAEAHAQVIGMLRLRA